MDRHIPLLHSGGVNGNDSLAAKVMLARALVQRCGACLALAALMLQLVLSFAHFHTQDLAFAKRGEAAVAGVGHLASQQKATKRLPSRLADDDDHCTICFSSFLLSNSSMPDAPANPPLPEFAELDRSVISVFEIPLRPRRAAFLSRAPPVLRDWVEVARSS